MSNMFEINSEARSQGIVCEQVLGAPPEYAILIIINAL